MRLQDRHARASALLASVRDIIDARPEGADVPAWCDARGWTGFLSALSDDDVRACERDGLAARLPSLTGAPRDIAALARELRDVTDLPALQGDPLTAVSAHGASPRKRAQVRAFESLAARVSAGCARVVDVGSGHGHLTRHLARALALPAEGWERDPALVATATALTRDEGARFVTVDVRAMTDPLRATDLVVGLHACGALGDLAVERAAEAGAAVVLLGCCLQKREGDRAPHAPPEGVDPAALTLPHAVLGLGNARDGDEGIEDDLATRTRARVHRDALRALLRDAGLALAPGEEMRGVNRRRATGSLDDLVAHAFSARGVSAPSPRAVAAALDRARHDYERARRLALPRWMLARLIEVWVALDRAALLARAGYAVEVLAAFETSVSPRNVAVLGRR